MNWFDPDNGYPQFGGNDIVTFTMEENVNWMNWSEDGKLFCYIAPENSDAGIHQVVLSLRR